MDLKEFTLNTAYLKIVVSSALLPTTNIKSKESVISCEMFDEQRNMEFYFDYANGYEPFVKHL